MLQKLPMAYPTISIDDHVIYFVSSIKNRLIGKLEPAIAVDVRRKTLRGVAELDVQKNFIFWPPSAHVPGRIQVTNLLCSATCSMFLCVAAV